MEAIRNITQLETGENAFIGRFLNGQVACKLMAMGLIPGAAVLLVRTSPFGGSYYIKSKNHYVALRRFEAENVLVSTTTEE